MKYYSDLKGKIIQVTVSVKKELPVHPQTFKRSIIRNLISIFIINCSSDILIYTRLYFSALYFLDCCTFFSKKCAADCLKHQPNNHRKYA